MTALMFAALFGKTAAMTALAKLKAQQRAVNRDGMNLLHLAAIAGRDESIAHILTNFTRVNALQNDMVCARVLSASDYSVFETRIISRASHWAIVFSYLLRVILVCYMHGTLRHRRLCACVCVRAELAHPATLRGNERQ